MDIKVQKSSLNDIKAIENEIRDILNWISVFEEEYDLEHEIVEQLRQRLSGVARKVGNLNV